MRSYKIIEHTADIRLNIKASSYQELFQASLEGMNQILQKGFCKKYSDFSIKSEITLTSPDTTSLLIDFLSDVLTQVHIQNAIFCKVVFKKLTTKSLSAFIYGQKVKKFDEDIKAISYHEAEIIKEGEGFKTNIIFDI